MSSSWKSNASIRRSSLLGLAAFVLFTLLGIAPAWAQKRVAITKLDGDKKDAALTAVGDAVGRKHAVIASREVEAARKKAKIKRLDDEGVAKLADTLSADAVITGSAKKKGKDVVVKLTVYDARGKELGTVDVTAKRGKFSGDTKDAIADEVDGLLAKIEDKKPEPPPEEPVAKDEPKDDEGKDDGAKDDESKEETAEVPAGDLGEAPLDRFAAFSFSLVVPVIGRDLSFDERAGLTADQRPTRYDGATVPAIGISIEAYPLVLGKNDASRRAFWRQFGVAIDFERVLALKSKSGDAEYDTTMQRWEVGLRWRWNVGQKATLPTVALAVGYGQQTFEIDAGADAAMLGLPNVAQTYINLGANVRVPFGTPRFALVAGGGYLLVQDGGDLNAESAYGAGSASGFKVDAGLEFRVLPFLPVRAGFRMSQVKYSFDGTGALSNNLDGDAASVDVSGGTEKVVGGYVSLGYLL